MKKSQQKHFGIKNRRFLWAKGLAICFFAILLMSHNSRAFDLTQEVNYQATIQNPYYSVNYQTSSYNSGWINTNWTGNNASTMSYIGLRNSVNQKPSVVTSGRFITALIRIRANGASGRWNDKAVWTYGTTEVSCPIYDVDESTSQAHNGSSTTQFTNLIVTCKYVGSGDVTTNLAIISSNDTDYNWQLRVTDLIVWSPDASGATSDDIAAVTSAVNSMKTVISGKIDTTNNKLESIRVTLNELNQQQEKEKQEAQDAIDDAQDASDSSSSDATNSTSSLIGAIGSFVGAVTTAAPTNCLIDGNMGKFDMGQIDLCANPVPTFVQIISSLILIAICVPFAIVMFNRFINLFRSFQS